MSSGVLDILAFVDSKAPQYPGGIPLEDIRQQLKTQEGKAEGPTTLGLAFVSHTSLSRDPKLQDLLKAAVTKGLNIEWEKVSLFSIDSGSFESLTVELKSQGITRVVSLGTEVSSQFLDKANQMPLLIGTQTILSRTRGTWYSCGELKFLTTHDIAAVAGSAQIKREFWNDLQIVLHEIKGS